MDVFQTACLVQRPLYLRIQQHVCFYSCKVKCTQREFVIQAAHRPGGDRKLLHGATALTGHTEPLTGPVACSCALWADKEREKERT